MTLPCSGILYFKKWVMYVCIDLEGLGPIVSEKMQVIDNLFSMIPFLFIEIRK